jgi:hypothetical protein
MDRPPFQCAAGAHVTTLDDLDARVLRFNAIVRSATLFVTYTMRGDAARIISEKAGGA